MQIVKMERNHIDQVEEIEKECFVHPWSKQSLSAELEKNNAYFFVAVEDGKAVGYIGLNTVLDEGYIANVAVLEKYRKKGIGKLLLSNIVKTAERLKLSFVTLEVRESNFSAISLYNSFGFDIAGRRKNFYSQPTEDAILMTKYFTY